MKRFSCVLIVVFMLLTVVGCSKDVPQLKKYNSDTDFYYLEKTVAAENDNFILSWDDYSGVLELTDKNNGTVWTTASVKDQNDTEGKNAQLKSPIVLKYLSDESQNEEIINAYADCMRDEMFSASAIENGVEVTYYFEKAEISVPVSYTLRDDSLKISVNPQKITENGNKILNIQIMPFMCSVKNTAPADSNYLFVPSGSGALIYPKDIDEGVVSIISEQVYGTDKMNGVISQTHGEEIRIPVYGAKVGNNAMCAVIEKGADNAEIVTNVGSSTYGYSTVYASFNLRGAYFCESTYMQWYTSKKNLYSEQPVKNELAVGFYPLSGENADYMGMAEVYRNYLTESKDMKPQNNDTLLNLKFMGGIETTAYTFGIPHSELLVTTTFEDVAQITDELSKSVNDKINVGLFGFTPTGLTIDKIAGNFSHGNSYGKISVLKNLPDKAQLYYNFDLLRFSSSGGGVGKTADSARTAVNEKLYITETDIATKEENVNYSKYLYVKRDLLGTLAQKTVQTLKKWEISGVCFDTLSSESYSDYSDERFLAKSNTDSQVSGIMKSVEKSGIKTASVKANAFAAVASKHIYDVPISSAGYQIYDCEIPFYQLVFKGYRSMSVPSVNLSADSNNALLKAAETGTGLTFTIIGEYDSGLINSQYNNFYNAEYEKVGAQMSSAVARYTETFSAVKNTAVTGHSVLSEDVRKTVFENGVCIYVNYGDAPYTVDGHEIPACDWITVKEGQ